MALVVKTNELPLIHDITDASLIGLDKDGVDAKFLVSDIKGDYKAIATPATDPTTTAALSQFYHGLPGTYTHFLGSDGNPVVIPTTYDTLPVAYGILSFNGTYWNVLPVNKNSDIDATDFANVKNQVSLSTVVKGTTGSLTTYTSASTTLSTKSLGLPFDFDGTIDQITFYCARIGLITFKIATPLGGGNHQVIYEFIYLATTVGTITLIAGVDYNQYFVKKGDGLFWLSGDASLGTIGYKTGTGSAALSGTGNITTTGAFTSTPTILFGVNFTISSNVLNKRIDQVNTKFVNYPPLTNEVVTGAFDVSTETIAPSSTSTRALGIPFPTDGILKTITFNAPVAGGITKFKILSKNSDGTYNVDNEFSVTSSVIGPRTIIAGIDFPYFKIKINGLLGFVVSSTGGVGYKNATKNSYLFGAGDISGSNLTPTVATTLTFGAYFSTAADYNTDISKLTYDIANKTIAIPFFSTARKIYSPIGKINHTNFLTLTNPDDWSFTANWIATVNGLQSPATGGWSSVYANWNKLFIVDEDCYNARVIVDNVTSIFSIARISSQGFGTAFEIDGSTNMLNLYTELTAPGATPASIALSKAIGFSLVAGREYSISLVKTSEIYQFVFQDTVTQVSVILNWNAVGNAVNIGKCWNGAGFIFRQGSIRIQNIHYSSQLPRSPQVFIAGDSIVDGDTIRTVVGGGYTNRWVSLVAAALNYNVTIAGKGGETTATFNDKLPMFTALLDKPKIALYELGINDTTLSAYQTNLANFKTAMEAKGAEVVPCTLFPRTGREAYCSQVTDYLVNSGMRYIDFAKAMTVGGDRVTRDNSLLLSDQLHPTPAGHLKMFNRVKIDLPELFTS